MREEFYHSQYGGPDQHYCVNNSTNKAPNYDEGVEIVSAVDREETRASESFLWLSMQKVAYRDLDTVI